MTDAERKARIERIRQHIARARAFKSQHIARARAFKSISSLADALELIVDLLEESKP